MYEVYCDDSLIYSPASSAEGYAVLTAKVTKELNKAGSFEFTIPPNNLMYDKIQKLKSIVKVVGDDVPLYVLKDKTETSKIAQTSIPTTVLYSTLTIDQDTGDIVLSDPFNVNGSGTTNIYNNYEAYPYFYGDLDDGTQDSKVYKFTSISKTTSSGSYGTVSLYAYTYYLQESVKQSQKKDIFIGRVLHDEKDFYNRKVVYCEGQLAFLLDSIQRPYTFQGDIPELFAQFLNNHNNQVDDWKKFEVGNITVTDPNNYINRESSQYDNTFDELTKKLIDTHGGYLIPRMENGTRYLDYLEDSGKTNSQVIEFGVNLLDITEYITAEDVFTVLIPLGAEQTDEEGNSTERLTIESVNDGKDYIENELGISLFGRITKVYEWDDVTIADNLLTKGTALLESGIEMSVSLTLKAVDLHLVNIDTESISVGDNIRVVSKPHGIDTFFTCSKIELNLLEPDKSVYTFGVTFKALTEQSSNNSKIAYQIASDSQKVMNSVSQIDKKLTKEEIFKILTNNGQVQGIIMDEDTGDIYINASYIRSGTLTIGGLNSDASTLQILDDSGNVCVQADANGIKILQGEINATSGSLESVTIVDGITISTKDEAVKDLSLVKITESEGGAGTIYSITIGEGTSRITPLLLQGSSIGIKASSGITFSADNIIFENSIEVPEVYITKEWTALTLKNSFENKNFEAEQLEYRNIGNHVYIRGAVKFPDGVAWDGSAIPVADLPTAIKPIKGNHYSMNACAGSRIARVIATPSGDLSIEWIRKLADGTTDTTGTGIWVSMNMDYWVD